MMSDTGRSRKIIKTLICLVLIVAAALAGWKYYSGKQGSEKSRSVMKTLSDIVPGLGEDTGAHSGNGQDPPAAVSIEGIDIIGVIEIPALDITAPVTGKDYREEYFASWLDGSPMQKNFKVIGGRGDIFRNIAKLQPGDRVAFTDIEGVRYMYTVTTQYHLKRWDEGDNDLMLCYESDSDTYFVVGCTAE